jgi:hypothetical protein
MAIQYVNPTSDQTIQQDWKTNSSTTTNLFARIDDGTTSGSGDYIQSGTSTAGALAIFNLTATINPDPNTRFNHVLSAYVSSDGVFNEALETTENGTGYIRIYTTSGTLLTSQLVDLGQAGTGGTWILTTIDISAYVAQYGYSGLRVGFEVTTGVFYVDRVFITVPDRVQVARPTADISETGTWSGGSAGSRYALIDETHPDAESFTGFSTTTSGTLEVRLNTSTLDPNTNIAHLLRWRFGPTAAAGSGWNVTYALYQGATLIKTLVNNVVYNSNNTNITGSNTLTEAEASNITDYSDLRLRLTLTKNTGAGTFYYGFAEMETPYPKRYGRPTSDITVTNVKSSSSGGSNISSGSAYTFLDDEALAASGDYLLFQNTTSGVLEVKLGTMIDPLGNTEHVIKYYTSGGDGSSAMTAKLYQGATLIATLTPWANSSTSEYIYTLSASEADAITDYSDLRIRFNYTRSSASTFNGINIFQAEMSVPIAPKILTATQQSYALTTQSALLLLGKKIVATQQSFALAGQNQTFKAARKIVATQQSIALTAPNQGFNRNLKITGTQAFYTMSAPNQILLAGRRIFATQQGYALTGNDVSFPKTYLLSAVKQDFNATGNNAVLVYTPISDFLLEGEHAEIAMTASSVNLIVARRLVCTQQNLSATAQNAELKRGYKFLAGQNAIFALTGQDAYLREGVSLSLTTQNYAVNAPSANLLVGRALRANVLNLAATAFPANIVKVYIFGCLGGSVSLTGVNVEFRLALDVGHQTASFNLSGGNLGWSFQRRIVAEVLELAATGQDAEIFAARDGLIYARLIEERSPRYAAMDD